MFFDPVWIALIIVSTAIGALTQGYVRRTYSKWSQIPLGSGTSGAQVARHVLDGQGLAAVGIQQVRGELSDHYDPRTKELSLSDSVYRGSNVAAAGVAAHEAGHAIQDAQGYVWGRVRGALVPVASFGSQAAFPLIIVGIFLFGATQFGVTIAWVGIAFYFAAVLFQIVTLPVEFDASRRALAALQTSGGMSPEQLAGARQVLSAAALTYVGAALISALQLLYFIGLARRN